jgi:predicted phage tail protein
MKKIQRIALGLALLAALAGGGASASAKTSGGKQRALSGVIQSIDLRARTVEVREQETGRVITVHVPAGELVRTSSTNQPVMQLERLLPGMTLSAVVR